MRFDRVENLLMFARVRPGDLIFAVVALAGLAAGAVLTVIKALGATGPALICIGTVAAVAGAIPGVRSQVSEVLARAERQDRALAAILAAPVKPLGGVDPFAIGVFPSDLARQAWQDVAPPGESRGEVPPYVPRGVDECLRLALEETSLAATGRLVVLRGDPKSGKSRSLWEAVRMLPGRRLLAVRTPDRAAPDTDPVFRPLVTLAGLDRPVSWSQGRDLVIWVDDAQDHLERGLSTSVLDQLAKQYPRAVIAMTIHSARLDVLGNIDKPLHARLRRPSDDLFRDLVLSPKLTPAELKDARSAYLTLADHPELGRLPELFAAVNLLIDRYRHHRSDQPAGTAVAKAAIDWQRAGMPPGSMDEQTLRFLADLCLADIAPNRQMDEQAFRHGIDWASEEVAAFAALLRRERGSGPQARRYRAFDAVVSWAQHNEAIGKATWEVALAKASDRELLGVGITALLAGEFGAAIDAFQRAARSASAPVAAGALLAEGAVFSQLGRPEDELAAYDKVLSRFADARDPALAEWVAMALSSKRSRLRQLGRLDEEAANGQTAGDKAAGGRAEPGPTVVPPDEVMRVIHLLAEEFMLLHLRSEISVFRTRWPAIAQLPPEDAARLRPTTPGSPGLGYARPSEVDAVIGVIAWSVVTRHYSRSRIRREADKRRLRPEVSDALGRFLSSRPHDEIPG